MVGKVKMQNSIERYRDVHYYAPYKIDILEQREKPYIEENENDNGFEYKEMQEPESEFKPMLYSNDYDDMEYFSLEDFDDIMDYYENIWDHQEK